MRIFIESNNMEPILSLDLEENCRREGKEERKREIRNKGSAEKATS